MAVLVITPRDDGASKRCGSWADQLAAKFKSALSRHNAQSRSEVTALLKDHEHVLYFGHGEEDALVVPKRLLKKRQVLVDDANVTSNPERVVIAIACWSGEKLARVSTDAASEKRITTYLGWRDEVSWPVDWPDPIGDAVVEGLTPLLEGMTVNDSADALKAAFDRAHDRYRTEGTSRMPSDQAAFGKMCAVYWRERMAVEGDGSATLVESPT